MGKEIFLQPELMSEHIAIIGAFHERATNDGVNLINLFTDDVGIDQAFVFIYSAANVAALLRRFPRVNVRSLEGGGKGTISGSPLDILPLLSTTLSRNPKWAFGNPSARELVIQTANSHDLSLDPKEVCETLKHALAVLRGTRQELIRVLLDKNTHPRYPQLAFDMGVKMGRKNERI